MGTQKIAKISIRKNSQCKNAKISSRNYLKVCKLPLDFLHPSPMIIDKMNSTKVQNPRRKTQVALLAEPKTPLESSVFIGEGNLVTGAAHTVMFYHRYLTSRNGIGKEQQLTPYRDTLRVVPEAPEAPEMT